MSKFLTVLFVLCSLCAHASEYVLSVCAIFQNEAPYLNEWVSYHHKQGVEHFWLYNNNSTDDYKGALSSWIDKGIVEIIDWPSIHQENDWMNFSFTTQTGAYNDGLERARNVSKWLALIDTDEFIVPVHHESIAMLLETLYSGCSGLCVNWQCYGTSGVSKAPEGALLQSLTHKMKWNHDWNKHSKSIVQPLHVVDCPNPHLCNYLPNHWAVDPRGNRCDACCESVMIDVIRLNHYWTRDEWFFHNIKVPRYKRWGSDLEFIQKHADAMNEEYDPIIAKAALDGWNSSLNSHVVP